MDNSPVASPLPAHLLPQPAGVAAPRAAPPRGRPLSPRGGRNAPGATAVPAPVPAPATPTALDLLRQELERREADVTGRENRLWGWRLTAVAHDAELRREASVVEERERALREREQAMTEREARLVQREAALEARAIALTEEHEARTAELRAQVAQLRKHVTSGGGIGLRSPDL